MVRFQVNTKCKARWRNRGAAPWIIDPPPWGARGDGAYPFAKARGGLEIWTRFVPPRGDGQTPFARAQGAVFFDVVDGVYSCPSGDGSHSRLRQLSRVTRETRENSEKLEKNSE